MPVSTVVFPDPGRLGAAAADLVLKRLVEAGPGRPFLLGCPGGRSARSTYAALGAKAARRGVDLSRLVVVMMDEYVMQLPGPTYRPVPHTLPHSCRRFAMEEILAPINAALARAGQDRHAITAGHVWVPDPGDPSAYERRLERAGGIDVFLLASGAGDGHVAFNPPGSASSSRTRVVELPASTRRDNLVTFPSFGGDLSVVPRHGVTVGVDTIRRFSREVIMLVHGDDKRVAAQRLMQADGYESDWPATVLAECTSAWLFLDEAAVAQADGAPEGSARSDGSGVDSPDRLS